MSYLTEIQLFAAIIEKGTFIAASNHLNIPKATVSRMIEELETRLGARLLQRTTRRMSPTEAGKAFYDHCGRILAEIEEAERAVSQLSDAPRGNLRVAAPFAIGSRFLSQLLPEFLRRYPEVRVNLVLSNNQLEDPVEGNFDVAIRIGALADSSHALRTLGVFHPRMVASPAYEKEKGLPATLDELIQHRALALSPRDEHNRHWSWTVEPVPADGQGGGSQQAAPIDPVLICNDPEPLLHAALGGEGLCFVPDAFVNAHLQSGQLVAVLPQWRGVATPISAVFPTRRGLSPKTRVFLDFISEKLI